MNLMTEQVQVRTAAKTAPAAPRGDIISYASRDCALGRVLVARSAGGVCAILIGAEGEELEADLAIRFPLATLVSDQAAVDDDLAKVIRFVESPAEGSVSRSTCGERPSSGASGKSFARFLPERR